MAIIRVSCPTCGQIELPSDRIELVCVPGRPVDRTTSHYVFACSLCGDVVRRPADRLTATVLTSAGVTVRAPRHSVFGSRQHPEDPPDGPALTFDDVLDLHLLLEDDNWFEELLSAHHRSSARPRTR